MFVIKNCLCIFHHACVQSVSGRSNFVQVALPAQPINQRCFSAPVQAYPTTSVTSRTRRDVLYCSMWYLISVLGSGRAICLCRTIAQPYKESTRRLHSSFFFFFFFFWYVCRPMLFLCESTTTTLQLHKNSLHSLSFPILTFSLPHPAKHLSISH